MVVAEGNDTRKDSLQGHQPSNSAGTHHPDYIERASSAIQMLWRNKLESWQRAAIMTVTEHSRGFLSSMRPGASISPSVKVGAPSSPSCHSVPREYLSVGSDSCRTQSATFADALLARTHSGTRQNNASASVQLARDFNSFSSPLPPSLMLLLN